MNLPLNAEQLVPHRGPMLLIDRLVQAEDGRGVIEAQVPPSSIVVDASGLLSPLAFVELVAQSYAALKGFELLHAQQPFAVGYLVGVQSLEVLGAAHCGEVLSIFVETAGEFEGFAVINGSVRSGSVVLANARIKLFVPPKDEKAR